MSGRKNRFLHPHGLKPSSFLGQRPNLDEQTQRVVEEEVNRPADDRNLVLAETKPFLERYKEKEAELLEFRLRLLALLKSVKNADLDAQAVLLMEALQNVPFVFLAQAEVDRDEVR